MRFDLVDETKPFPYSKRTKFKRCRSTIQYKRHYILQKTLYTVSSRASHWKGVSTTGRYLLHRNDMFLSTVRSWHMIDSENGVCVWSTGPAFDCVCMWLVSLCGSTASRRHFAPSATDVQNRCFRCRCYWMQNGVGVHRRTDTKARWGLCGMSRARWKLGVDGSLDGLRSKKPGWLDDCC